MINRGPSVPGYEEKRVNKIIEHISSSLQEGTEDIGVVYPSHWNNDIDKDDDVIILGHKWDGVGKGSHLGQAEGDTVVCIHHVHIGHVEQTMGWV